MPLASLSPLCILFTVLLGAIHPSATAFCCHSHIPSDPGIWHLMWVFDENLSRSPPLRRRRQHAIDLKLDAKCLDHLGCESDNKKP